MAKMTFTVSLEEFGKKAAEFALDEITYNDLTIREWAEKIASGEFAEVRHGRWIEQGYENFKGDVRLARARCSECKRYAYAMKALVVYLDLEFCPNCGAKMDGKDVNVATKNGGADE